MVVINEAWWLHLAPKAMHRHRKEMDTLLRAWLRSNYGAYWLGVARHTNGLIRVSPGQAIPVFHAIKLGDRPMFVAPLQKVRPGHRNVGPTEMSSGRALADGELPIAPQIRLDVVDDPVLLDLARRGQAPLHFPGVKRPSQLFTAPAHLLLAPTLWPRKSYVLYQHIFGEGGSYPDDGWFYVGLTTRSWQARWAEHQKAIRNGGKLKFHRTFREELAAERITYVNHKIMGVTDDLEALYRAEEALVEGHWDDQRRLNMIPGGKDGLRYLREHGVIPSGAPPEPDEREPALDKWTNARAGDDLPPPWLKERWQDRTWAAAQICSRSDRLSIEQMEAIRALSKSHSAADISAQIGAGDAERVQRVIDGRTYKRVTY